MTVEVDPFDPIWWLKRSVQLSHQIDLQALYGLEGDKPLEDGSTLHDHGVRHDLVLADHPNHNGDTSEICWGSCHTRQPHTSTGLPWPARGSERVVGRELDREDKSRADPDRVSVANKRTWKLLEQTRGCYKPQVYVNGPIRERFERNRLFVHSGPERAVFWTTEEQQANRTHSLAELEADAARWRQCGMIDHAVTVLNEAISRAMAEHTDRVPLSLIHISEPTRLLSISYAVFCLKKKKKQQNLTTIILHYYNT
eukprot:TRINITY_DN3239_c0_g1_i1.p1 TRINITY_DN3239_c0_g1~~TRINITY_DN3239_c0_g1_i1.p1  ORF type:complete len:255 (-),score=38.65 TRINITY_DN3239_c0_g1_i1:45-809(-)